jgi:hypothetical protein
MTNGSLTGATELGWPCHIELVNIPDINSSNKIILDVIYPVNLIV